jgi:hypothetical protein
MVGVRGQAPLRFRAILIVLVAVGALACLGGLAGPAMAMADGQGCSGPGCGQQIVASRPPQFQAPSAPVADLLAIPAHVGADLSLAQDGAPAADPPPARLVWPALAPFAPRSPPVA